MSRFRSLIFPLALALILGGISSWLDQISQISEEVVQLNPKEPQYLGLNVEAKRFDATGSLHEKLASPRMWQLPNQENVYIQQPHLQLFEQNALQYEVRSQNARYELNSKTVFLDTDVQLDKTADAERPAAQVNTSHLTVNTVTQIAQTDAPIQYQYGQSTGSSVGMTYDHKNGQLNLPAKVKALIYANQP